ncbi:MAG: hypothetical protein AAF656_03800 [Planctomycetota bacterium]
MFERTAAWVRWSVVGVCCGVPIVWALAMVALHPATLREAWPVDGRGAVLLRTLGVNATAALLAVGLGAMVFRALRYRVGVMSAAVALAMPGLVWAYAGAEALRWLGPFAPQSWPDVARGIVSLGLWLWPVPAVMLAVSAGRLDGSVLQAADLDGARRRVAMRLLVPAALAGGAAAFALATGTFAVWDASGIRVTSTVVRTVFDTGTFVEGVAVGLSSPDARAASAISTALPTVVVTLAALVIAVRFARTAGGYGTAGMNAIESHGGVAAGLRRVIVVSLAALPVGVLVLNLPTLAVDPRPYLGALAHGISLALLVGLVTVLLGATALVGRPTITLALAMSAFLLGGQWLAIAWIRLLNQPVPEPLLSISDWVYGGDAVVVLAHVGRFGWLGLAAGWFAWSPGMRGLRRQAAVDGASAWRTFLHVTLPTNAIPLIAAGLGAAALALGEIQATVLLVPDTLPPRMATWLHIAADRAMTEASVVLAVAVGLFALTAATVSFLSGDQRELCRNAECGMMNAEVETPTA